MNIPGVEENSEYCGNENHKWRSAFWVIRLKIKITSSLDETHWQTAQSLAENVRASACKVNHNSVTLVKEPTIRLHTYKVKISWESHRTNNFDWDTSQPYQAKEFPVIYISQKPEPLKHEILISERLTTKVTLEQLHHEK